MQRIVKNISNKKQFIRELGIVFEIDEEVDIVSFIDCDYIAQS